MVQQTAEGRGGGGVEEGAREDVAARTLPHQRRPRAAGPDRRPPLLHLPQGAAGGAEGVRPRRRRAVRQLPGAGGGHRVGLLPIQPPGVQPRRVLGPAQGGRVDGSSSSGGGGGGDGGGGGARRASGAAVAVRGGLQVLLPAAELDPVEA